MGAEKNRYPPLTRDNPRVKSPDRTPQTTERGLKQEKNEWYHPPVSERSHSDYCGEKVAKVCKKEDEEKIMSLPEYAYRLGYSKGCHAGAGDLWNYLNIEDEGVSHEEILEAYHTLVDEIESRK